VKKVRRIRCSIVHKGGICLMMHTEPRSGTVRGSVPELCLPIPVSDYSRPGGSIVVMRELVSCGVLGSRVRIGTNSIHRSTVISCPLGPMVQARLSVSRGGRRRKDHFLEITERGPRSLICLTRGDVVSWANVERIATSAKPVLTAER